MFTSLRGGGIRQAPSLNDFNAGMLNFIGFPGAPYQTSFGIYRGGPRGWSGASGTGNPGNGVPGGGTGNPGGGNGGGGNGNTQPPPVTRPPYQWTPPQLMMPPFGLGADWRETMMNYVYPPNNQGV